MSIPVDELITEKIMDFIMFLTNVLGDRLSEEEMQTIASRLEMLGEDIKRSIADVSSKLQYFEENSRFMRQQISDLTKENEHLKSRIENLLRELKRIMGRYIRARRKLKELERTISELEKRAEELELKVRELEDENTKLGTQLAELTEEKQRLEDENKYLKERLEALEKRHGELEKKLREFESKLIRAANFVKREMGEDALRVREMIRRIITELRTYVVPQGRSKLERISSLVNTLYMKITSKDIGGAILRLMREETI